MSRLSAVIVRADDIRSPSVTFTASSNLPIGAGLGSSAAYSTCIASALLLAHGFISLPAGSSTAAADASRFSAQDADIVDGWAFLSEKILHGNPSGIDNAVSVRGGAVAFTRSIGGRQGGLDSLRGWVQGPLRCENQADGLLDSPRFGCC